MKSTFSTIGNFHSSQHGKFLNREEFDDLKAKGEALDTKLKFYKEYEEQYRNIKFKEIEKDITNTKYLNAIAKKRNEDLLNSLQSDIYRCYHLSKTSNHSRSLLETEKKKYSEYLSFQTNNMKNEFNLRLMAKQNELIAVKSVLESQVNQNEEVLRMENEYATKMAKMNEELNTKVNELIERNKKLEEDRRSLMLNYSYALEDKSKDMNTLKQASQQNKSWDTNKTEETQERPNDAKPEPEKEYRVHKEEVVSLNLKHKAGILDKIRKEKLEREYNIKKKDNQDTKPSEVSVISRSNVNYEKKVSSLEEKNSFKNHSNFHNETINKEITKDPQIIKDFDKNSNIKLITPAEKLSFSDIQFKEENERDLSQVKKDHKIQVLKRIIYHVEKVAKGLKPGTQVYQAKHANTNGNKELIHAKFKELLDVIVSTDDMVKQSIENKINSIDLNIILQLIFEILRSNLDNNLNSDNLREIKEYSIQTFVTDLSSNIKEIFEIILEHIKRMLKDKRVTLPIATNFLARSLLNFAYNDLMYSKMIIILEQIITQTNQSKINTSKTFGGFTNTATNSIKTITTMNARKNTPTVEKEGGAYADYD